MASHKIRPPMRDFHHPGRSTVHAQNGMAACSHPLASLTAIDILRDGGNAIDAAVAASAVLCVVEPMMTGIGGDCFALIAKDGKGPVIGLNGSGHAPAASDAATLRDQGLDRIPRHSPHAVTIPGAIAAWAKLIKDHGRKSLGEVLQPAIRFAEEGFVVSPRIGTDWMFLAKALAGNEGAARNFLVDGKAPAIGSVFRAPRLGATLKAIAAGGPDAFYKGVIAEEMVTTLQDLGGCHQLEDFAAIKPNYVEPVSTNYRGYDVYEIPPNGQGITALTILNIFEGWDYQSMDPMGADRFHRTIETGRIGLHLRDRHVADMDMADVPVDQLLSKDFAQDLRDRVDLSRRNPGLVDGVSANPSDTIYLTVVDQDRTAVSFINSVYFGFGSGICTSESAVMFQNRGQGFTLEEGHPNELAGGKRPKHTIIPAMMTKDDKAVLSFGVMGGDYQAVGHAQIVQNLIDFGMDLQEAIDCPRVFDMGPDHGGVVHVEKHLSQAVRESLAATGHDIGDALIPHGGAQAIWIDPETGTLTGGSDPRKDGCALGY